MTRPSILQPKEVKRTCAEIEAFLNENASACAELVRSEAISLARQRRKTVASIREDGMSCDQLALVLITNVLGRQLSSGRYHLYQGTLGSVANDMLKVWRGAVETMIDRGYYTKEEGLKDMRWVVREIENAG